MIDSYTMDEFFETRERNQHIDKALSTLGGKKWGPRGPNLPQIVDDPGREEKVIRMRFGMNPYSRSHTSMEVAEELDVSYSRAREIEFKSLRKLRNLPDIGTLKIFLGN